VKLDRFKQVKKTNMREEYIFVNGFCRQYMTEFLTQDIFTDEAWFHLNEYINAQNNG
jgi:hypothetical protein